MTVKAIETAYAGCLFRSRLEARWAVFFDYMQEPWSYEPEGLDLDGVRYLPDFYLPQRELYVEVKGQLDAATWRKAFAMARAYKPLMLVQEIPDPSDMGPHHQLIHKMPGIPMIAVTDAEWIPKDHGAPGVNPWPHGFPDMVPVETTEATADQPARGPANVLVMPGVAAGYRAARSARFEFGRSGAPVATDLAPF